MTVIYALIDPQTRLCRYVGKTKGASSSRLKSHISDARRHPNIARFRWINKLGRSGLIPEVIDLEETPCSAWQEAEQFWIAYMRSIGSPLLNCTDGGDGIHGHRHSAETKARMGETAKKNALDPELIRRRSESLKVAFSSPEVRQALRERTAERMKDPAALATFRAGGTAYARSTEGRERASALHLGKKVSAETRDKISAANRGRKWTDEQKAAASERRKGRKHSPETLAKMKTSARARALRG